MPYVENIFGITSPVKLLELSNPNQPLLKKLLVEAPGTYHHSVIVGNLAEAAADKIGADSLLARVGAYYHDIGKIKRAYFFTENQIGSENPHDKLSPNLSTLIITSHVKDGVELAHEHKLPSDIIDIIKQHHGTSLVSFFYQEAMHDEKYKQVDEDEFRYDGPKPQSKEAALIMLADMVEAAVRSNSTAQSNPGRLEKLVRDLIKQKLDSGQLDESDLTLKDLDKIAKSFVNILKGIFHNRIEYPDNIAKQFDEGGQMNGSAN
ncbi:MAG: HDIG domain-containing protein [Halanaerobacter sp.]